MKGKISLFRDQLRPVRSRPSDMDCNCNCNNILFAKLSWPGDSEETIQSSSKAAACPPVYHTRLRLPTIPLIAECQAEKL